MYKLIYSPPNEKDFLYAKNLDKRFGYIQDILNDTWVVNLRKTRKKKFWAIPRKKYSKLTAQHCLKSLY